MRQSRSFTALAITLGCLLAFPILADQAPAAPAVPAAATTDAATAPATAAVTAPAPAPAPAAPAAVQATAPAPAPAAAAATTPGPAKAAPAGPIQIKVNENVNFRFGLLLQPQADFQQNTAGGTGENVGLRRTRLLLGGQMAKQLFFFYMVENSRLGYANAQGVKTMNTGFQTLDAAVEWRPKKAFNLQGGLIRVPTSRDALESAANEFTIDFNTYAFTATGVLGGTAGRDTGLMARGYFLKDRFEYRAAVVSGVRQAGSRNALRKTARVQYNFFDTEVYNLPSYVGNNYGAKKIVAIGAAYDTQLEYTGLTADVFADIPVKFGSVLGTATYQNLDGGKVMSGAAQLPESTIKTLDFGGYFKKSKIGPWVRFEQREFANLPTRDEERVLVGLNYYIAGNNFNIKAAYGRLSPAVGRSMNQFVVQLQAYYY